MLISGKYKNIILGLGGAGSRFIESVCYHPLPDTLYHGIKSILDFEAIEDITCDVDKIFIVTSFASDNSNSAYKLAETILPKISIPLKRICFLVFLPFEFEGKQKRKRSYERLTRFHTLGYNMLAFDNQELLQEQNSQLSFLESFKKFYQDIHNKIAELAVAKMNYIDLNYQKWQYLLNAYQEEIGKIELFKTLPSMLPYIGSDYNNNNIARILFVGDQTYLPSDQPPLFIKTISETLSDSFGTGSAQVFTNMAYINILKKPEPEEFVQLQNSNWQVSGQQLASVLMQIGGIIQPQMVIFISQAAINAVQPFISKQHYNWKVDYKLIDLNDPKILQKQLTKLTGKSLLPRIRRVVRMIKRFF